LIQYSGGVVKPLKKIYGDFLAFGKVVSAALLLCGFVVLGLMTGKKLEAAGKPGWVVPVLILVGGAVGAWQAWAFLRQSWKKR
jgi:hypothetical protein